MTRHPPKPTLFPYTTLFRSRTAWHTHPLGQTLIVIAGCGWAQREGGPVEEIRPGDAVWFPPGENQDRKSTRLNSSHVSISYAVFCLKKKKIKTHIFYNQKAI